MVPECYEPEHQPELHAQTGKKWLDEDPIFLDTETTGLDETAEIVEIGIIDINGEPLLETFIKPHNPIPKEVTKIHGITNEMVNDAPYWSEIHEQFCNIIKGRTLIIYNRSYDVRLIDQTIKASIENKALEEESQNWDKDQRTLCAMKLFAAYYGMWDEYHEDWKWQKLTAAAHHMNVKTEGKAHRAVTDCLMTLGIIQAMGEKVVEETEAKDSSSENPKIEQ